MCHRVPHAATTREMPVRENWLGLARFAPGCASSLLVDLRPFCPCAEIRLVSQDSAHEPHVAGELEAGLSGVETQGPEGGRAIFSLNRLLWFLGRDWTQVMVTRLAKCGTRFQPGAAFLRLLPPKLPEFLLAAGESHLAAVQDDATALGVMIVNRE